MRCVPQRAISTLRPPLLLGCWDIYYANINTCEVFRSSTDHVYYTGNILLRLALHINMSTAIEHAAQPVPDCAPNSAPVVRSTRRGNSTSVSFYGKVNVASTYGDEEYDRTIPMRRNYSALELATIVHELRWYKKTSMPVHPNSLSKRSSSGLAAVDDSKYPTRAQMGSLNILAATTIFREDVCEEDQCNHDTCHSRSGDAISCT